MILTAEKETCATCPFLSSQIYEESANMNVQHPDAHLDFNTAHVMHIVMTQLSMKARMKCWGKHGTGAISKELQQLHHQDTFELVDPKMMTSEDFHEALKSHLFLKQKCDESIKGRMVADGSKQHTSIMEEDTASPTVALKSVFLMAMIDAAEGRDVTIIDILNAFIQTQLDDDSNKVLMRLHGKFAKLMVEVAPEIYSKYVSMDSKGELVLYVCLLNALYGIMKAALLYYECFVCDIMAIGFKLNPYNPCVANKTVCSKQLTITWHVDDLKVSHKKYQVVSCMVRWLKAKYEQLFEDGSSAMMITHGKIHDYLGMQLDFSMPREVKVTMIPYVKKIVTLFEQYDNSTKTAKTPASEHLFKTCKDMKVLPEKQIAIFHTFVAKNLFALKCAWPDISVAVAFLCTRVKNPDEDDWKKLIQLVHYLRGTAELPFILHADSATVVKWWVDGSHAIHPNMCGHSGGCVSLGMGMPITGLSKQKLNMHSSTETELIVADDFMLHILWTNLFLKVQDYKTLDTILYQDNQSAILLEKNSMRSSSKQTKHLNCHYYFITNRISAGDLSIKYCPTGEMVGDFFMKPLQGKLFLKFFHIIMNLPS